MLEPLILSERLVCSSDFVCQSLVSGQSLDAPCWNRLYSLNVLTFDLLIVKLH